MFHFVKKPKWLRRFYGDCIWEMDTSQKTIYLTFDDGPDPSETPFVLDQLKKYNATATFFCIGENVAKHPDLYNAVVDAGHATGNHSYSHLDGWKTGNRKYYHDIAMAQQHISSNLFRPPYGHITWNQVRELKSGEAPLKTILWSVLSADFAPNTSPDKCFSNVADNAGPGSIILFHDAAVASKNLRHSLPKVLDHFTEKGYAFESIKL